MEQPQAWQFGSFTLLPTQRLLLDGESPVRVGGRALDILMVLVKAAGEVVGHDELMARVWQKVVVDEVSLRVHVAALRRVDGGVGVLVLTDLYGASPSNLAAKVARLGTPVRRVSALSLPMLLRVMNYAELELDELPAVAAAGARNGVIHDDA